MTPDTTVDAEPNRHDVMAMSIGSKEWEDRLAVARAARAKVLAEKARSEATPPRPAEAETAEAPPQASPPTPPPNSIRPAESRAAAPARRRWPLRIAVGVACFAIGIGGGAYVAHLLAPPPRDANASIALTPQPDERAPPAWSGGASIDSR